MTATMRFPFGHALAQLELLPADGASEDSAALPAFVARLVSSSQGSRASLVASLVVLLTARKATLQAAFDTTLSADELRRYQKFAKPGKPSAHIVQLRQKQAAARHATNVARQSLIKAAGAFVREAGLDVPERTALDAFIIDWIDAHIPEDDA